MKRSLSVLLIAMSLLLSACTAGAPTVDDAAVKPTEYIERFSPVEAIDHCVLEPDDRARLSDRDTDAYRAMMEGMLSRRDSVTASTENVTPDELLDLMRESPYYFFLSDVSVDGDTVNFSYAYSEEEQRKMLDQMDSDLLRIADYEASEDDNALDVILKIYLAVTHEMEYDLERTDNKELGSPLFRYPADEVYKALRDKKSLCYGFAYVMRFALLQRGVDCFCVYGLCTARGDGHEWIIFRYDDAWFHCDPAWDRVADGYAKLIHFGKTDREREVDTLQMQDFASYHDADFGEVTCTDDRFSIIRGMSRFSYAGGHRFSMSDLKGKKMIFDTETFSFI